MKKRFRNTIILSLLFSCFSLSAQTQSVASLHLGDKAPPLKVQWVKGTPIPNFVKGKVYVLDFWATWCGPCIAIMPHLSDLARKYKDKIIFLAVDVMENDTFMTGKPALNEDALTKKIKGFMYSMGNKMDFRVALDDSGFMVQHWLKTFGESQNGIPRDFVINAEGTVVWIGHPVHLDTILPKIVGHKWSINKAIKRRSRNQYLKRLDQTIWDSAKYELNGLGGIKRADAMLSMINRLVKNHPTLKYAPNVAMLTFRSLLVKDPGKAYDYGEKVIHTGSYSSPAYASIYRLIEYHPDNIQMPGFIYGLGADAYGEGLKHRDIIAQENSDTSWFYNRMAAWYLLAGDSIKAEKARQKSYNTSIIVRQEQSSPLPSLKLLVHSSPYLLDSERVLQPVKTDTSKALTKMYRFYLPKKSMVKIAGKDTTYLPVSPGEQISLKREPALKTSSVKEETNITFLEKPTPERRNKQQKNPIRILNDSGMLLPNPGKDKLLKEGAPELFWDTYKKGKMLKDSTYQRWIKKTLRFDTIRAAAQKATTNYLESHPEFGVNTNDKQLLKSWYEITAFQKQEELLAQKQDSLFQEDSLTGVILQHRMLQLAADLDRYIKKKPVNYWRAMHRLNKDFLMKKVRSAHYDLDTINHIVASFDDTTAQFILLDMLSDPNSKIFQHNLTWTAMADQIKFAAFQDQLKRVVKPHFYLGANTLNIALRSVRLINTSGTKVTLDTIFQSTRKPYLYLIFCGSWNEKSRKKLASYSKQQVFEDSKKIHPVWIFFENNKTDWLKIIRKYHLPEQDCFMVKDPRKMERNFSNEFGWQKNFPHYFLFTKEGKCLNNDAPPFLDFDKKAFLENQEK